GWGACTGRCAGAGCAGRCGGAACCGGGTGRCGGAACCGGGAGRCGGAACCGGGAGRCGGAACGRCGGALCCPGFSFSSFFSPPACATCKPCACARGTAGRAKASAVPSSNSDFIRIMVCSENSREDRTANALR